MRTLRFEWKPHGMVIESLTEAKNLLRIYHSFDFEEDPHLDGLQVELLDEHGHVLQCSYWPCDGIKKEHVTANFLENLESAVDEKMEASGSLEIERNLWISKLGTLDLKPLDVFNAREAEREKRISKNKQTLETLQLNMFYHLNRLPQPGAVSTSPESVLRLIRRNVPTVFHTVLPMSEDPINPRVKYRTSERMIITGGPCYDLIKGYHTRPWQLELQRQEIPDIVIGTFYFTPTTTLKVLDTCEASEKLPAFKKLQWTARIKLYEVLGI